MPDDIAIKKSRHEEARQEYAISVATYSAQRFAEVKQDAAVYRYLVATERIILPSQGQTMAAALQAANLGDPDILELTDYMFRHFTDDSGQTIQDRYLAEVAPTLSEPVRRLAEIRATIHPGLWQIRQEATPAGMVTLANLFDGRRGRLHQEDAGLVRRHAMVFGELAELDDELVPLGLLYITPPAGRGWLMKAIERSFAQARAASLVDNLQEFFTLYEPWIRGAMRVLNGATPRDQAVSYLPALGRVDLGQQVAKQLKKRFKVPADFRMPEWGIQFGTPRAETPKVDISHRYVVRDPRAWANSLSRAENFLLYRTAEEFGWYYLGDPTPFASEQLHRNVSVHPILADIRFADMDQMVVRVYSSRIFKRLEPALRALAPQGQVLPKPVAEVTPLEGRMLIYQVQPDYRGYYIRNSDPEVALTAEEQAIVDSEWMAKLMLETPYRWAGGKTLPDLVAADHRVAVEDFLNQIDFLTQGSLDSYRRLTQELRSRLELSDTDF